MPQFRLPCDPSSPADPPPPKGYASWLEYAVASFDAKSALTHTIFDEESAVLRDRAEAAVWTEFNALRVRAGLEPASEQLRRGPRHDESV